jgi:cholera toxin transcriptional activator
MLENGPPPRFRFGIFEANAATGELRRNGLRVRIPAQPFQILLLLLDRPGELLTREDICRQLWPEGTFVDYDHSVNSAVNRLREVLGDRAGSPRFIETLARRGYRFLAPVEKIGAAPAPPPSAAQPVAQPVASPAVTPVSNATSPAAPIRPEEMPTPGLLDRYLATPQDLPTVPHPVAQALFVALQLMYLGFYIGALANLPEVGELLAALTPSSTLFFITLISAAILIPVRTFLLCAVLFRAPRLRLRYLQLWPFLLAADILWSLSPFLLLHHISFGLALACVPFLVYAPFAQRSLILMGAAGHNHLSASME